MILLRLSTTTKSVFGTSRSISPSSRFTSFVVLDYQLDGKTTYCYWLNQGLQVENPDASYINESGLDSACPVTLQIDQVESGIIFVDKPELYHFKVTLNLKNAFHVKKLYTSPDPFTGRPAQIAHANIHICMADTKCDIFQTGMRKKVSTQETSNFTDGIADFWQTITFDEPGKHIVLAHVIIPSKDITRERYDMLIYTTATVNSSNNNKSTSIGTIMGIVMGCLAFVVLLIAGFMYYRRTRMAKKNLASFFLQPSSPSTSRTASKIPNQSAAKLGWSVGDVNGAIFRIPASCDSHQPIKISNDDLSTRVPSKNLSFHMSHTYRNVHKGKESFLLGGPVHLTEVDSFENDQTLVLVKDDIPHFDAIDHTEELFPTYPGIYGSKNGQDTSSPRKPEDKKQVLEV